MIDLFRQLFESRAKSWQFIDGETGADILSFTAYLDEDIKNEGATINENIEEGSFTTVNKTEKPVNIVVNVGIAGDESTLHEAISTLNELKSDAVKFSLVSPNYEYQNLTLVSFNYGTKKGEGIGKLVATLTLTEVREVSPAYSSVDLPREKVKNKETASRVKNGQKQTRKVSQLPKQSVRK